MQEAHYPKGTIVCVPSINDSPVGKIVAHRPIRIEGLKAVANIYAVQSEDGNMIHLLFHEEITPVESTAPS